MVAKFNICLFLMKAIVTEMFWESHCIVLTVPSIYNYLFPANISCFLGRRLQRNNFFEDVFSVTIFRLSKVSWRRSQDLFARRLLQDVLQLYIEDVLEDKKRSTEDVLKIMCKTQIIVWNGLNKTCCFLTSGVRIFTL